MAKDLVSELVNQDLDRPEKGRRQVSGEKADMVYMNIPIPVELRQALKLRATLENVKIRDIVSEALWKAVDETHVALARKSLEARGE